MKKLLTIVFLFCCLVLTAQENTHKKILVICPYSTTGSWGKTMLAPLLELETEHPNYSFFFQTFKNTALQNLQEYEDHLQSIEQLFPEAPDLVLVYGTGNYSLLPELDKRWKGVPIIASGELDYISPKEYVLDSIARPEIQRIPMDVLQKELNMTFLHTPVFVDGILNLMQNLIPDLKEVVFIGGEEYQSREVQLQAKEAVEKRGLIFTPFLTLDMSTEEMLGNALTKNQKTTAFFYCNWHRKFIRKEQKEEMDPREMLETRVPLFYTYNTDFERNHHLIGTESYNLEKYNETLKSLILKVLAKNEQPSTITNIKLPAAPPVVNIEALNEFRINTSKVPSGAILVNIPPTFWQRHAFQFMMVTPLLLFMIALVAIVVAARQRKIARINRRSQLLLENMPISYDRLKLIRGADGKVENLLVMAANQNMRSVFESMGIQNAIGMKMTEIFPESGMSFVNAIREMEENNQEALRYSVHITEIEHYIEVETIIENKNTVHKFVLNVTDLMETQEELKVAKDKAEKSNQMKTQFVQNMSHEIRTPLNAIVGFSQLLSLPDGFLQPEEKEKYGEYIQNSSSMLMMLIDDILDLSDVENGQYNIEKSEVFINNVCTNAVKTVEYRTPPGVRMYFTTDVKDSVKVYTDARRVQQVLINYLTNACKHTSRGEIHLHCTDQAHPGFYSLSVTDTGTGVPLDQAEKIFERFTKLNVFKQGTGLGLNICRTVAEKLNGKAFLDTTYTQGARFVFEIPMNK